MNLTIKEGKNPKNGKPITIISGIRHNPQVIDQLATLLKSRCGAGGFTEGKKIILNGSHTDKAANILRKEGYEIATR